MSYQPETVHPFRVRPAGALGCHSCMRPRLICMKRSHPTEWHRSLLPKWGFLVRRYLSVASVYPRREARGRA
jgi:hypothetical protein